jgi:hypothetical protein
LICDSPELRASLGDGGSRTARRSSGAACGRGRPGNRSWPGRGGRPGNRSGRSLCLVSQRARLCGGACGAGPTGAAPLEGACGR